MWQLSGYCITMLKVKVRINKEVNGNGEKA